jgi:hypothetical protein
MPLSQNTIKDLRAAVAIVDGRTVDSRGRKPKPKNKTISIGWKVHTPCLLDEILNNNETQMLRVPINILCKLLHAVAERASQINDPELNRLMLRLTLYEMADPNSKQYRPKIVNRLLNEG